MSLPSFAQVGTCVRAGKSHVCQHSCCFSSLRLTFVLFWAMKTLINHIRPWSSELKNSKSFQLTQNFSFLLFFFSPLLLLFSLNRTVSTFVLFFINLVLSFILLINFLISFFGFIINWLPFFSNNLCVYSDLLIRKLSLYLFIYILFV